MSASWLRGSDAHPFTRLGKTLILGRQGGDMDESQRRTGTKAGRRTHRHNHADKQRVHNPPDTVPVERVMIYGVN